MAIPGIPPIDGERTIDTMVRVKATQNAQKVAFVIVITFCNSQHLKFCQKPEARYVMRFTQHIIFWEFAKIGVKN